MIGRLLYLIGPSGSGKDSILNHLKKHHYTEQQPQVAHRYITRSVRENDENHIELSEFDYKKRLDTEQFLFHWQAHDMQYAIGKEVLKWTKKGNNVIVNGSRQYLEQAIKIYPKLVPLWIDVSEPALRQRLEQRGRETALQINDRIERNNLIKKPKNIPLYTVNNDFSLDQTVQEILSIVVNHP